MFLSLLNVTLTRYLIYLLENILVIDFNVTVMKLWLLRNCNWTSLWHMKWILKISVRHLIYSSLRCIIWMNKWFLLLLSVPCLQKLYLNSQKPCYFHFNSFGHEFWHTWMWLWVWQIITANILVEDHRLSYDTVKALDAPV